MKGDYGALGVGSEKDHVGIAGEGGELGGRWHNHSPRGGVDGGVLVSHLVRREGHKIIFPGC